jgi:hypothetical protein
MTINMTTSRRLLATSLAMAGAAIAATAPGALAAGDASPRVPAGNVPFDIPAADCGFPIHVGVLDDQEYYVRTITNADGSTTLRVTGYLLESFTNEQTGKTITENMSGPGSITINPDGSDSADVQGNSFGVASPASQQALGVPGVFFTTGHAVASYSSAGNLVSLSVDGPTTNGCALLS